MEKVLSLLLLSYLIGSVSPGYFFGRITKGIDVRKYGNHNTGATNTYHQVGPIWGILTGLIDFVKAPLIWLITVSSLKIHPDAALLIALGAVAGHIAPVYLGFRGGRGIASLSGLFLVSFLAHRSFAVLSLYLGIIFYTIFISEEVKKRFSSPLRKLLKLLGIPLCLSLIWLPQKLPLVIVGLFLTGSVIFDLARILFPKLNRIYLNYRKLSKEKEARRLSGYSFFLIGAFLVLLFFPKEIAIISLVNFLLGDTMVVFAQTMRFLPQAATFGNRTLAGAIIIFWSSLISGLFLQSLSPLILATELILSGAILTTLWDQISFSVDDNLFVPLGTAVSLLALVRMGIIA